MLFIGVGQPPVVPLPLHNPRLTDPSNSLQAGKTVDILRCAAESTDLPSPSALPRQQAYLLPGFSTPGLRPPPFRGTLLPPAFSAPLSETPVFTVSLVDDLPIRKKTLVQTDVADYSDDPRLDIYISDSEYFFEISPDQNSIPCAFFHLSSDYSHGKLKILTDISWLRLFALNNAVMTIYALAAACRNTVLIHASAVLNSNKAFLFLGKSGIGKSTQSRLWLKYVEGSRLLNDDTPVIRLDDSGILLAYGTPWSGKTRCYKNSCAPIGAIVLLRQSSSNAITRLSALEPFAAIYQSCSGLGCDEDLSEIQYMTLERIVSKIPFYLLDCRPDRDAAQICAEELLHKITNIHQR